MSRILQKLTSASAIALIAGTTACSDNSFTAPIATPPAPAFAVSTSTSSRVISQVQVGDTTITVFVVGTNTSKSANFALGNGATIDFPNAAGSICDVATSSYGPGTWNSPCLASSTPVTITAKSWVRADGLPETDFQPAMRFRPGLPKPVFLWLRAPNVASGRIDFRAIDNQLSDEAQTDASLTTQKDIDGRFYRPIKHFSGYTVTAD